MADTRIQAPAAPEVDQSTGDRSFWASTKTVLSLALILLILAAGVWLILDEPDASGPGDGRVVAESPAPGRGEACGPGGGSQVPPSVAPRTNWQLIGSMAAPISLDAGPAAGGGLGGGVPTCFSPDPVGALFAAATFLASTTDPELRTQVLDRLVADGPGKDAAAAEMNSRGPGPGGAGVQIAGFTFLSYSETESAVVDLALVSRGVFVHVSIELVWGGEDWKVVLPVTGRPFDQVQALSSMAGYVPWQGA